MLLKDLLLVILWCIWIGLWAHWRGCRLRNTGESLPLHRDLLTRVVLIGSGLLCLSGLLYA